MPPKQYEDKPSSSNLQDEKDIELAKIEIHNPTLSNYAETIYTNDPNAAKLAHQNKLPTGEPIDYILVYETPKIGSPEYEEISNLQPGFFQDGMTHTVKHALQRACFESQHRSLGFKVETEVGLDEMTHYVKLHAPFKVLCEVAEKNRVRMQLVTKEAKVVDVPNFLERIMTTPEFITRFFDSGLPEDEDYLSAPFKTNFLQKFAGHENEFTFFNQSQRSLFTYQVLRSLHYGKKPRQLGIGKLLRNGGYKTAFPLHDGPHDPDHIEDQLGLRNQLWLHWARFNQWHRFQPLDQIRTYFGEKIALYFAWLGFYTSWLIVPAIVGLIVFFYGVGKRASFTDTKAVCDSTYSMCGLCETCGAWSLNTICQPYGVSRIFDTEATVVFGILMSLWSSFFVDFWTRQQNFLAYDYEVLELEEEEPDRPDFKPTTYEIDEVTGEKVKTFPLSVRRWRMAAAFSFMLFMIALVIIIVVAIIAYRLAVTVTVAKSSSNPNSSTAKNASVIASFTGAILNLIGIMILNIIYGKVAVVLNDWENHRTDTDYEDALTFKYFVFSFVNSYTSIFYIAFFKGRFIGYPGHYGTLFGYRNDACPAYGCLLELTIQLAVIMVGKQAVSNALEVFIPTFTAWLRRRKQAKTESKAKLPWEREYKELSELPPRGLFAEYLEMIVQFGFVTLFITAFPLGPLFALINNIFEIRIDSNKFVTQYRRPPALRAEDIGLWQKVVEVLSVVAVISNGAVIAFSTQFVDRAVYTYNNGNLDGFVGTDRAFNLSAITQPRSPTNISCHYSSNRDDVTGFAGSYYYQVLMAKLAFLIVFEHVVFILKALIQYLIPDVPGVVEVAIKKQEYQAKKALESQFEGAAYDPEANQGLRLRDAPNLERGHSNL